jgi:HlyD family secretion protein
MTRLSTIAEQPVDDGRSRTTPGRVVKGGVETPPLRDPRGKPRLRRSLLICLLTSFAALLFSACSSKEVADQAPTMTVQVATVERGTIQQEATADGVIYPLRQAAIVPKISAPVSKLYVDRGSHVHAGQLLAELESKDLAATVAENKGVYEQAEAAYQTATKSAFPEEMQKAELDMKAAKESLDAQQKVFDARQNLYQQGAIPRKDLEDATVALTQARNQHDITRKHWEALQSYGNSNELKAAQGQLAAAKGKYDGAQAQLGYAQIKSPIDGVVTDRPLYPGEMAAAGSALITVMDLSRVVARAHLGQRQAALLKVGDDATLSIQGLSEEVPAKVSLVSPALDPNSTTVEVWAEAANSGGRLQPGSSARITFVARAVKDALIVPAAALITASDGAASVMVVGADSKPQQKTVKAGLRQDDKLQIVEGLQEGDKVVTQGAYELAQEDPDVLGKTKLQVATPGGSDSGKGADKN